MSVIDFSADERAADSVHDDLLKAALKFSFSHLLHDHHFHSLQPECCLMKSDHDFFTC